MARSLQARGHVDAVTLFERHDRALGRLQLGGLALESSYLALAEQRVDLLDLDVEQLLHRLLDLRLGGVAGDLEHALLGQADLMAAHERAERTAAAAEQVDAGGAVTGVAGALLRVHFLTGTPDLGAVLDFVGAGAALGELPDDATLNDVVARLEPEDV